MSLYTAINHHLPDKNKNTNHHNNNHNKHLLVMVAVAIIVIITMVPPRELLHEEEEDGDVREELHNHSIISSEATENVPPCEITPIDLQ